MQYREGGGPPDQDGKRGTSPEQRALLAQVMQEREGGGTPDQEGKGEAPPEHRVRERRRVYDPQTCRGSPPQDEAVVRGKQGNGIQEGDAD